MKATIAFILVQVFILSLFGYFMAVKTAHAKDSNTAVITAVIEDFRHVDYSAGKVRADYFTLYAGGDKYRLDSSCLTVDTKVFTGVLESAPKAIIVVDRFDHVVELSIDETPYCDRNQYNSSQNAERIVVIILFCLAETVAIPYYFFYMKFHRTSKDRKQKSK